MKRNIIIFCLLISWSVLASGQHNANGNEYVKTALTEAEINGILSADPNGILYFNYLIICYSSQAYVWRIPVLI